MMNTRKILLILATVCALTAGRTHAGTGSRYNRYASTPSRVLIHRAANFGTFKSVNVYIDGAYAGNVAFNRDFEAFVPAGSHVVALEQTPRRGAALLVSEQRIDVPADATAVFTLLTIDGGTRAVLERS